MKGTMIVKFNDGRGKLYDIHDVLDYRKVMLTIRRYMPHIKLYKFIKAGVEVNPVDGSTRLTTAPGTYLFKGGNND